MTWPLQNTMNRGRYRKELAEEVERIGVEVARLRANYNRLVRANTDGSQRVQVFLAQTEVSHPLHSSLPWRRCSHACPSIVGIERTRIRSRGGNLQ